MERVHVRYSGRVQGVGFRATVSTLARNYNVSGFVRNVHDGTVELVAEGEPEELRRFLDAIAQRMGHFIVDQHETWEPAADRKYDSFGIAPTV